MSDLTTTLPDINDSRSENISRITTETENNLLKILSYNIQVGITTTRMRHYFTHMLGHVLPHAKSLENLDRIAALISDFDMVAIQEADGGSIRSQFINQVEYLAEHGAFPHWYQQRNRNLGRFAQHSNGLLSKHQPTDITEYKLPGLIPGRGVMTVQYGSDDNPLFVLMLHLALSRYARTRQLEFVSEIVNRYEHVVVMGDFNCTPTSPEMAMLLNNTKLSRPTVELHTFPSWRPRIMIDHILTTPSVKVRNVEVLPHSQSDHLPIAMEIVVPDNVNLGQHGLKA